MVESRGCPENGAGDVEVVGEECSVPASENAHVSLGQGCALRDCV